MPMSERRGYGADAEIEIDALLPADSPRFGISAEHVESLVTSIADLPPILVHRSSMRIIDGVHRVQALRDRGERTVHVRWFEGDDQSAFLRAVRTNTSHGLPLSTAERKCAAARILDFLPGLSDRALASMVGLSDKTVASVRRTGAGTGGPGPGPGAAYRMRIGRDGRVRPTDGAPGRIAAADAIRQDPAASLRLIAARSGVSVGTARDVRRRIANGEDPVPMAGAASRPERPVTGSTPAHAAADPVNRRATLETLLGDPSFRMSETGRAILRQLSSQVRSSEEWAVLAPTVPHHGRWAAARILSGCASDLLRIADSLNRPETTAPSRTAAGPGTAQGVDLPGQWAAVCPPPPLHASRTGDPC